MHPKFYGRIEDYYIRMGESEHDGEDGTKIDMTENARKNRTNFCMLSDNEHYILDLMLIISQFLIFYFYTYFSLWKCV